MPEAPVVVYGLIDPRDGALRYIGKANCAENGRKVAAARRESPEKDRLWRLRHLLGVSLSKGFVREDTKAKMRALAARRPDLFGDWAYI